MALILLALIAFVASNDLPGMRGFAFGPGTAPRLFAFTLAILSLGVVVGSLLSAGPHITAYKIRGVIFIIGSILVFAAWGSGPQSSGPTPPDLEELLRRSQDRLRRVLPGGNLGGRGFALLVLGAVLLWGLSGFFRVEADERGVILRFGREVREVDPGLNYHLPYPIETVLTPKALQVRKIDVGMASMAGAEG